jgi:hypothetical protein
MKTIGQKIFIYFIIILMVLNVFLTLTNKDYPLILKLISLIMISVLILVIVVYIISLFVSIISFIYYVVLGSKKSVKKYYKDADVFHSCNDGVLYPSDKLLVYIKPLRKFYKQ